MFQLCHCCAELYKTARGEFREKILSTCLKEGHVRLPGSARCASCLQYALEAISRVSQQGMCQHEKLTYIQNGRVVNYGLCQSCLEDVCSLSECNHSKTEILAAMKPISWSAMLVETTGGEESVSYPRIVCEKTYVASNDSEDVMPPFWEWLKSLRGLIYETWRGKFVDVGHCVMSEEEKKAHADAKSCYVCLETFKSHTPADEQEDFLVDFVIGGEEAPKKVKKCIKVLDHSHHNARYRGLQSYS